MADADKLARNREMWDERVPIHVASRCYDVDGFKAGLDKQWFARLGARVVGVDFSAPAVAEATALADELGLDGAFLEYHEDGTFHSPPARPQMPLMYSIRMRKPA